MLRRFLWTSSFSVPLSLPPSFKYSLTHFSQWKCGYPLMISLLLQILSLLLSREDPDASLSSLIPFKVKGWLRFFCPLSFTGDYLAKTLLSLCFQNPYQIWIKWTHSEREFSYSAIVDCGTFSLSFSNMSRWRFLWLPQCFHCLNSDLGIQVLEDLVPLALVFPSLGHPHAHNSSWHEQCLFSGAN